MTLYQHLKLQSPFKVGTKVYAGQKIGIMGNTGYSSAAHLHMELRVDNMPIDPLPYLQKIQEGITDMTEDEVIELIDNRIKTNLKGTNKKVSNAFIDEYKVAIDLGITDGSRPQGYAKREEVVAMIVRAMNTE